MATILVTGSTDGIGKQTALELAREGHEVIVHGRNADKGREVVKEIGAKRSCNADFGELDQVRAMAEELKELDRLDVVINNAAVWHRGRTTTPDGNELTLSVNFLAPFLLTTALLPKLLEGDRARVVNVAALVHASRLDLDNLQGDQRYSAWDAYARSKLYLIMFTYALSHRVSLKELGAFALHPGVIDTKMLRATGNSGGAPREVGARRLRFAALDPSLATRSGLFLVSDQEHDTHRVSRDRDKQRRLWELATEMTS